MSLPPPTIPQSIFDVHDLIQGKGYLQGQHFYGTTGDSTTLGDDNFTKLGATVYAIKNGQRQPMPKTCKNPQLEPPSVMAMRYLGQFPIFKVSMDQVFHIKAGVYPAEQNGSALSAFNFMNLPTFSGTAQLTDVIAQLLVGTPINANAAYTLPTTTTELIQQVGTVSVSNTDVNVIGTETNFTALELGDQICVGTDTKTIEYIANDSFMEVDSNFSVTNTAAIFYLSEQVIVDNNSQYTSVASSINSITASVASIAGASPSSLINLSDPSHAIPFMQAYSSVLGSVTANSAPVSLFSNDVFANGYSIATQLTQTLGSLAGGQAQFGSILNTIASGNSAFSSTNISSILSSLNNNSNPLSGLLQAPGNMSNILGMTPLASALQSQNPATQQGAQILAHIIKKNGNF